MIKNDNQDYPPNGDLQAFHPKLYEKFSASLDKMFKAYMGPNGPLNLFSYIPEDGLPPDLGKTTLQSKYIGLHCLTGPKLYISKVCVPYSLIVNTQFD